MGNIAPTETILAAATGSAGGLGKIANIAATTGKLLVRCPNTGFGRTDDIDWRVSANQVYTVQKYRSRNLSDYSVTLTLASFTEADTIVLNGLTLTGESTAADATFATRKFSTAGGTDTLDAAELAKLINADNTITPNGSVSVGDTITVTTTDDAGGANSYVYTAAAVPSYSNRVFDQSGNQAAELASIILALNHRRNFKLASVVAGTTVTIRGQHADYTYTAHADTTSGTNFSIAGTNAQDAAELATAINTQSATHGYTATVQNTDEVHISRNSASIPEPILTASASTVTCTNTAGGVPGVTASATGATGELALTPTWVKTLAVETSNGTRLATADIDIPGVYATSADAVVTLTMGTPGSPTGGEAAYVIQATAAARCTVAAVMTNLSIDGDVVPASSTHVANSTISNGRLYNHDVKGWPQAYIEVINGAGSALTAIVAATKN